MGVSSATTDGRAVRKGLAPAASRPPREDHGLPTSLDKLFSEWKVLVGPDDWQNHHMGLEGAVKYKLHNLPSTDCFHSGVYELALYLDKNKSIHAHRTRKGISSCQKKDTLVPIYVGQAENVRNRLQDYGRCGSHLEGSEGLLQNGKCQQCETIIFRVPQTNLGDLERMVDPSNNFEEEFCSFPHLFTRSFRRGYSIAFRWKATKSKVDAAALEACLLQSYDYAWNRGNNGERRPDDAFGKLRHINKARSWYDPLKWINKLPKMGPNKVCNLCERRISVTAVQENLWRLDNPAARLSITAETSGRNTEIWRRQAKEEKSLASFQRFYNKKHNTVSVIGSTETSVCGIIDGSGVVCKNMPVLGRKRCTAHTGMRLRLKPTADDPRLHVVMGPSEVNVCGIGIVCSDKPVPDNPTLTRKQFVVVHACKDVGAKEVFHEHTPSLVCGYLSKDGFICTVLPEKGRKRCTFHKGRRIKAQL